MMYSFSNKEKPETGPLVNNKKEMQSAAQKSDSTQTTLASKLGSLFGVPGVYS
jgi:hypothetical protein